MLEIVLRDYIKHIYTFVLEIVPRGYIKHKIIKYTKNYINMYISVCARERPKKSLFKAYIKLSS